MTGSITNAETNVSLSDRPSSPHHHCRDSASWNGSVDADSPGLVAGTRVLTADGIAPVELLGPGDRIITRNTGLARLIGLRFHQHQGDFLQIKAGVLGRRRPDTDTILATDQTVFLRGENVLSIGGQTSQLIRVADLPPLAGCSFLRSVEMTLVQLIFDAPQLVYADGLETLCLPKEAKRIAA